MKTITIFVINLIIAAGLVWLSGYNFDTRNLEVMFWTIIIGFWCLIIAVTISKD